MRQFLYFLCNIPLLRSQRWRALMLIPCIGIIGVVGFKILVPEMSWLSAVYATVITLSTVGLQDKALAESTDPIQMNQVMLFEVFLVIFGIGAVMLAFAAFTRFVIEGEMREIIGQHRTKRRLHFMKDHYIICGFGRMGRTIVESMAKEKIPVVVIEHDPTLQPLIADIGVTALIGDATDDALLQEAEIGKAKGLIACTNSDPENLFVTLSARQLNSKLVIVARALSPNAEEKLKRAGADRVILPYKIGAHHLAQAVMRPNVVDFLEIATRTSKLDIELEEMRVAPTSPLVGKTLQQASIIRDLGIMVIGTHKVSDGQVHFKPSAETVIDAKDTLIVLGQSEALKQIQKHLM